MYKVFTGDGRQYVGCSEALANDFYNAAVNSGRCVMMLRKEVHLTGNGLVDSWEEIKEHVA